MLGRGAQLGDRPEQLDRQRGDYSGVVRPPAVGLDGAERHFAWRLERTAHGQDTAVERYALAAQSMGPGSVPALSGESEHDRDRFESRQRAYGRGGVQSGSSFLNEAPRRTSDGGRERLRVV